MFIDLKTEWAYMQARLECADEGNLSKDCQNLCRIITKVAPNASKKDIYVFKMSVVQGSNETLANRELRPL